MPFLTRADAHLYYEEYGEGTPILLFAPGGMRSNMTLWHTPAGGPPRAWNDWTEVLPKEGYRVIAMDQRNAGQSTGTIGPRHGWETYAGDQLALMDHLGIDKFLTLGGCIGSSFCLMVADLAPARIMAAVLQNPIGRHPEFPMYFQDAFVDWSKELRAKRPELDPAALESFGRNMWSEDDDFVFAVDRDAVRRCQTPCLVLPGDDAPHPAVVGLEVAELLPKMEMLRDWKGPAHLDVQRKTVLDFLNRHR